MSRRRKDPIDDVVAYFDGAPLAEAEIALRTVTAIVKRKRNAAGEPVTRRPRRSHRESPPAPNVGAAE